MKNRKESYFWTSYSDLMTSLFFIMLTLFILTVAVLHSKVKATQNQLDKIEELNKSIEKIDTEYFEYNEQFKRHTLKNIEISFDTMSYNIYDISSEDLGKLLQAGLAIQNFMRNAQDSIPEAEYLLIIEGQSSKDTYKWNDELSYRRALSLVNYWKENGITFKGLPCELIVSGSGYNSPFRDPINEKNQRFVIHIIPKPGIMDI